MRKKKKPAILYQILQKNLLSEEKGGVGPGKPEVLTVAMSHDAPPALTMAMGTGFEKICFLRTHRRLLVILHECVV